MNFSLFEIVQTSLNLSIAADIELKVFSVLLILHT